MPGQGAYQGPHAGTQPGSGVTGRHPPTQASPPPSAFNAPLRRRNPIEYRCSLKRRGARSPPSHAGRLLLLIPPPHAIRTLSLSIAFAASPASPVVKRASNHMAERGCVWVTCLAWLPCRSSDVFRGGRRRNFLILQSLAGLKIELWS